MKKITCVLAREILDSRGNPTIEVEISAGKIKARAAVPSGASTGVHEALELRDGGKRFLGKGVSKAVNNVNKIIARKIRGKEWPQKKLDDFLIKLDGTKNKSKLGANAILGLSLANSRLRAKLEEKPLYTILGEKKILPVPCLNIINGGKHADNKLDFQEFMLVPLGKNFKESIRVGSEIYHQLKKEIKKRFGQASTGVGDEGGFAPNIKKTEQAAELIIKAAEKLGYEKKIRLATDVAASELYHRGKYLVEGKKLTREKLLEKYLQLIKEYPFISVEDPFDQEDWEGFVELKKETTKKKVQLVGDDLTVTNPARIKTALEKKAISALLLKVNQIGTLTEALEAGQMMLDKKMGVMASHRSGETCDDFIADLAVGLGCGQIKSGAPCRGERTVKYNQLLRIEEELGKKARFLGKKAFVY